MKKRKKLSIKPSLPSPKELELIAGRKQQSDFEMRCFDSLPAELKNLCKRTGIFASQVYECHRRGMPSHEIIQVITLEEQERLSTETSNVKQS